MSASIDERVVSMKFKSEGVQQGVASAKKALQDLKQNLNFDKAKGALNGIKGEFGKFNTGGMQSAIDNLASRFDALRVAGVAALATLASQAVVAGQKLVQGLLSPIKQGLEEYETNLNSVQTILANTQVSGAGLKDVNSALEELNTYSDKTIYNFSEMARNIGTFTAAGVDLDSSTAAIKGIANLAALSGSNSQQASSAMYQLSQALASGKVGLMDWNSVVNAGMGGTVFQRALAQTAVKMGTLSESAVSLDGKMKNVKIAGESFRDSISAEGGGQSWLTSDVLTKTLNQFTGDMTDAQLAAEGFSAEQIKAIQQQAKTAQEAATEVKTFTALMGTLAESQGSGWAKSFQLIFGDFEQAKQLWTGANAVLGDMINASSDARNKILEDWQKAGGRDAAIQTISNLWQALLSIVKPIGEAFQEIFPPASGKNLAMMTKGLADFTAKLKIGGPAAEGLKSTFKGFFAILDIGWMILKGVLGVIGDVLGAFGSGSASASGGILNLTGSIGDFLVSLRDFLKEGNIFTRFFQFLGDVLALPVKGIVFLAGAIGDFFGSIQGFNLEGLGEAFGRFADRFASFAGIGDWIGKAAPAVAEFFQGIGEWMQPGLEKIGEFGKLFFQAIMDGLSSGSFSGVLDLINTGLIAGIFLLFKNFFGSLKGLFGGGKGGGGGIADSIKEIFGGVTDTLSAMQDQLKSKTLLNIAIAVGILAASVIALSFVDSARLTSALVAITVMFAQMSGALAVFSKIAGLGGIAKIPILAGALILLGAAVAVLAGSVMLLSRLSWDELFRGLTGLVVILGAMVGVSATVQPAVPGMYKFAGAMVVLGVAVKILASAVADLSALSWEELVRGLGAFAAILVAVNVFNKYAAANKGAAISGLNILLLSAAMKLFASAVADFAQLDLAAMAQGLIGVGVMLKLLAGFTNNAASFKGMLTTAAAMVVLGAAMKIMASAVQDFASMDWNELARGLLGMAGALLIVVVAMNSMGGPALIGAAALVVAAAGLKIMASALQDMGGMSWEEIGKSMVTLAGSLLILALGLTAMIATLPGAAALVVAAAALALLAPVLAIMGAMQWSTIWTGLGALALTLGLLAVAGMALIPALPGLIGLGVAIGLIGIGVGVAALGIGALVTALVGLGTAGPMAATGITAMATSILNLLPLAMQKLGEGIVAFANVIGSSGPALVTAFVALISSLLSAINTVAPQILNTMVNLIMGLLNTIQSKLPQFIDKGGAIIIGFLNGIASKMPGIINAATNLIVNFINGISRNIGRVVDAATNLMINLIQALAANANRLANEGANAVIQFVRGLASTIRAKSGEMRAAGLELASAIVSGMTGGLTDGVGRLVTAARNMAGSAISAAKDALGIHSPSRVFRALGNYTTDGMSLGIEDGGRDVARATEQVGRGAVKAMQNAVKSLDQELSGSMDTTPTIRPVLDLTNIRKGARSIDGMMGVASIKTNATMSAATDASRGFEANRVAAQEAAQPAQSITYVKNFDFQQQNHSPVALSEGEIYRQSRSLLAQVEEELSSN